MSYFLSPVRRLLALLPLLAPAAVAAQAPAISSLSPGSGPLGTTVTVGGSNLGGATSVLVGGVPAAFAPGSAAQLTFTVPRQAVSQRVRVSSASGTGLSTATFQVTRPSTSGVFPALGNLLTSTLDVGVGAAPTVTDVDGDGLLDLLVGNGDGNVLRYEQAAANASTFTALGYLTTDGTTALLVASGGAAPTVTDVDGDGRLDLLVGNYNGDVRRFEQTATHGGIFALVGNLTTDGTTALNAGDYAAPTVADLDGDGLLDLLVGNGGGGVVRFEQTATNGSAFAEVGNLGNDAGGDVSANFYASPTVADVDNDGLLDLLLGNDAGNVQRYEQTAANAVTFTWRGYLSPDGTATRLDVRSYAAPAATDLDGDGRLDLLLGNLDGNVVRFEQTAANGSTFAEVEKLTIAPPAPLTTTSRLAPTVTDVDGDGRLDLLLGDSDGYVQRYEQTAVNGTVFVLLGRLTAPSGAPLVNANATPAVTDLDGDGLLDLLVGNHNGDVRRFEQTAANAATFRSQGGLTADGNPVGVGGATAPVVTDVDGDGLLDLLVGSSNGNVGRFEQTAVNADTFTSLGYLTTDGTTTLNVVANAAPTVTDLDGDGLLDLLVGNRVGNVRRYEQTAANGGTFALVGNLTTNGSTAFDVGDYAVPTVTDLDGDGVLDLLVGNYDGTVLRYEQMPPPTITALSPASGPLGTTLTLTGTNLTGLTSVLVGGVPAASFTVQSATQATAVVPRQATSQPVRVTNAIGTGLSAVTFQVTRPSPSAVLPALGALTTDGTTALDVGTIASPAVTDLDGDGLLDLLVGNNGGTLRRFEQTTVNGTAFAQVGGNLTTDNGYDISVTGYTPSTVTDLDGDGLLDLLVGTNNGNIARYEQATAGSSVFTNLYNLLLSTGSPLSAGTSAAPAVTDLDGNGLLDLLVGNYDGNLRRYEQTTANGGVFVQVGSALTTDGTTWLDVGSYATPTVTDLDGDGLLDVLVGNRNGTVLHYEQATAGGSVLAPAAALTTNGTAALSVGDYAAVAVTDVDGDGLLDLLMGGLDGQVRRFEQAPVPTLTALSPAAELPGQAVTLTGTGFVAGSTVRFGGVPAASVSFTSATQLTAVVPVGAMPGTSPLTVGSYDVASPAASSPAFEVLQVYRSATASACLNTASLTVSGTGGTGVWRYLRLAGTGGAVVAAIEDTRNLGTVTAQVLALGTGTGQPVRQDGGQRRYLDRNFTLAASTALGTGNSVRVRFFGLSSELSRLTAADPAATAANLKFNQYSGPNEDCDLANNSAAGTSRLLPAPATTLSGADWFTAQATVTDHFSEFYLTGASTPLPVQLVTFTAQPASPAAVALAWTTASEVNSAAFKVERSADGMAYTTVGTVAAAGSSSAPRRYELLDSRLPGGATLLYYRLKQVDLDGTFSYSPVRTVVVSGPAGLALFPNPTTQAATLTGAAPGTVVTVSDALGRPVLTATADATGTAALPLPQGLVSGVYVVRVGSQALRLVVE